jgi:hypothetical protein
MNSNEHTPMQESRQLTTATMFAAWAAALGCLGLAAAGCSDGRPERVPVSGTVLIDGQPLKFGSIMFIHPASRPSGGSIDSNGHFVLSCYEEGDGAVLGKHRVKVTACQPIDERSNRWHAPKKYADEQTSGIEIDIAEPADDLAINLTWSGGQPFVERW